MDSAFLTGGTGFVGASLVRLLLEQGLKVKALARKGGDRRNLDGLNVEIVEGGLADKAVIEAGADGCRYVFHVAADYRIWVADPADMYATNVQGTVDRPARSGEGRGRENRALLVRGRCEGPHDKIPVDEAREYAGSPTSSALTRSQNIWRMF